MSFSITPVSGDSAAGSAQEWQLRLEGRLEFDTAAEALQRISDELAGVQRLDLNLAAISAANSAGLALLIEIKSMALHSGKSVTFSDIPHSLQMIAEVCQVQDLLA